MLKFRVKTKDCNLIVRVKPNFGDAFDLKKMDQFHRVCDRSFLKPVVIKKNLIEYSGPIGISLYERMAEPMSKRDFLIILEQIVVSLKKIEDNRLDMNAVNLDLRYIFINTATREVRFLYCPTTNMAHETDIRDFIESLAYSVKPYESEDPEFVSRFMYFLHGEKQVDLERMERYIAKEDGNVVRLIRKQAGGQSGFITNKLLHYVEHYNKEEVDDNPTDLLEKQMNNMLDEEATGLLTDEDIPDQDVNGDFDADEATGLLLEESDEWDDEKTGRLWPDDIEDELDTARLDEDDTVPLQGECEDTILLNETVSNVRFPTLYRVSTDERISVNKPVFRIGKEKSYVDCFIANNGAVSRSHADIVTRGRKHFVIDLNSKNHTYINDEVLPAHCEVEIHNEDRLRLGNEDFVFFE